MSGITGVGSNVPLPQSQGLNTMAHLRVLVANGNFTGVEQLLADPSFIKGKMSTHYNSCIIELVDKLQDPQKNHPLDSLYLQKIVTTAELFSKYKVGTPYSRLSCAAAYLRQGQEVELEKCLLEICQSRGKDQPSDSFKLSEMLKGGMSDSTKAFFTPLQTAVREYVNRKREPLDLTKLAEKV